MKQFLKIAGYCQAKERPFFHKNGFITTREKTKLYEEIIKRQALEQEIVKHSGPVALVIKIKRAVRNPTRRFKDTKSDIDNLIKSIMDGLNGIAYNDDRQVVILHSQKEYGDEDSVSVCIMDIYNNECLEDYLDEIRDVLIYDEFSKYEGDLNYGD